MAWYGIVIYLILLLTLSVLIAKFYGINTTGMLGFADSSREWRVFFLCGLLAFSFVAIGIACAVLFDVSLPISPTPLNLAGHLTDVARVYYYPFIYIFLLITVLSILFCAAYNSTEIFSFSIYCFLILIAGYSAFFTDSLVCFFFAYELLLVPSFFILYKFAKTRRCVEAAYLMFFWTQFGALFLMFGLMYLALVSGTTSFRAAAGANLTSFDVNLLLFCWFVGFGVKLPIWPFYGWLPKAHVEASTNFSIFLSGVLVKFAFFGFLRCLITVQLEPTVLWMLPLLMIGVLDATFKLFYQIDLKKLVAYSTVVEMHWLVICVVSGHSGLWSAGFCMLISHALLSTNSFLLVDAINRRFKTRLITEVSGLNLLCPRLFLLSLINCLTFLGFPGSLAFLAEVFFFSAAIDYSPAAAGLFICLLYLIAPISFFRAWFNVLFGAPRRDLKAAIVDLGWKEVAVYGGLLVLMFWLGLTWQIYFQ